jgi:hypothetical protein
MSIDDVVDVQITKTTGAPSRLGFGIPLLVCLHDYWPALVRTFTTLTELTDAGVPTWHAIYRKASMLYSQNPRPARFVVGKRTRAYTQTWHLIPKKLTALYVYEFTIDPPDGAASVDVEVTLDGTPTLAEACTALAAAIDTAPDMVATSAGTHVVVTMTAGKLANLRNLPNPDVLGILDVSADPGIDDDLADIEVEDPDSWYAFSLDTTSTDENQTAATWAEARIKIFVANSPDHDILDALEDEDLASLLKDASLGRSGVLVSVRSILSYSADALLGAKLPTTPGASTWNAVTLRTVLVDKLTGGQVNAAKNKNANVYTMIAGLGYLEKGCSASGEFFDITHGADWLRRRMQERVFGAFSNASNSGKKIPYTDQGVTVVAGMVEAQLSEGVANGFLSATPSPKVTAPRVGEIDIADRAVRHLQGVTFEATMAGAIHTTTIRGNVTV